MSHCGEVQQNKVDAVQKSNLQNEINAMKEKGIKPVMENGKAIWLVMISYEVLSWQIV